MKMDGIIFDVDGTLWDSRETIADAWNQAIRNCSDLDLVVDIEMLKKVFGKTMDEIYAALMPGVPQAEQYRIGVKCFEYENQLLEIRPGYIYEGVIETFRTLAKRMGVYIVSNCQCGYIELFLKASGLEDCVKDHLCFGETFTSKGQTIRTLMERNHLKDVVYVGDTQGDADACKEAGIPFIFAAYGFGNVPNAAISIQNISQLTEMF